MSPSVKLKGPLVIYLAYFHYMQCPLVSNWKVRWSNKYLKVHVKIFA